MDAQTGHPDEAQLLQDFFRESKTGSFVEVGIRDSGSVGWLEDRGWSGVVAEPRPDVAAFLVTARKARIVAAACVAPDVAGQPMPLRIGNPLSSIEVGRPRQADQPGFTVMVPTRTLDDILEEAEVTAPLDLLALGAQGRELDALLGLDFARWRPRLILIADPVTDLQRHRFLGESGYVLIRRESGSGWYVPADSAAAEGRQRWPILRDYYLKLPFRMAWQALRRLKARIMATE